MRGIQNNGNDCYFISVFQALFNIPQYMLYLLNNKNLSNYEKVAVITYKQLQSNNPMKILELLRCIDPQEFDGSQKDAGEFMIRLMENYVDNHKEMLPDMVFKRDCLQCHNSTISESILFPIWVEKKNNSNFIIPEPNMFLGDTYCEIEKTCEKCGHKIHSEKNGYRDNHNILFMAIKRFNYDGSKDTSVIQNINNTNKKLVSVVCHIGNTMKGHYFTLNNIEDKWIMFNDEKVEEIDSSLAIKYIENLGYILIYLS